MAQVSSNYILPIPLHHQFHDIKKSILTCSTGVHCIPKYNKRGFFKTEGFGEHYD